jgi:hypothetical protein
MNVIQRSGHGGTSTAEYTARTLSGCICAALRNLTLQPGTDSIEDKKISVLLIEEFKKFDREIGEAVIAI